MTSAVGTSNQNLSTSAITSPAENSNDQNPIAAPHPQHSMITRSQSGIVKPNPRYALHVSISSDVPPEPKTVKSVLAHIGWNQAMFEEYQALQSTHTWKLVPRPANVNIIGCKWVYKAKLNSDGKLDRLKARLVAKGFH